MEKDNLTINIYQNSDGDINYDIYNNEDDLLAGNDAIDGGTCTSDISNALEMAFDMAKEIINNRK